MRRRRWLLLALVVALVVVVVGVCFVGRDANGARNRTGASTEFEPNKALFPTNRGADQLILYEGLPHPNNEELLFLRERLLSWSVRLHGFLFYHSTLDVPVEDVANLKALLGNEKSFVTWQGERKCGGFHPDYLVEWRVGGEVYRTLLCFGCGEVKIYGPTQALLCDMGIESRKQLEMLLKKYHKNRPASEE